MRIMRLHAHYRELGGEDVSVRTEVEVLRRAGHDVHTFFRANGDVAAAGAARVAERLWRTSFDRQLYAEVREQCRRFRPDVAHADNLWFALSPSVHAACHDEGVATVQSLRNYRLMCVGGTLMRDGQPCETCVGQSPWSGVVHRCYRGSALLSGAVARTILENRRRGTWLRDVDRFVTPSAFARKKFIEGGLPAQRILVKPNFCDDPGPSTAPGCGGVFVGRLAAEKGVATLLEAWRYTPDTPLEILGDGPDRAALEAMARDYGLTAVAFRGLCPHADVLDAMRDAAFVLFPSESYETFGRVVVEAYACGRPVIVSDRGAPPELVVPEATGLVFPAGDAAALAERVAQLVDAPARCARMGRRARAQYLHHYSADANRVALEAIYTEAIDGFSGGMSAPPPCGRRSMKQFSVLGVPISETDYDGAIEQIDRWFDDGEQRYVTVTGVHGVMESQRDAQLKRIHQRAGMCVPDGMPMVWVGKLTGHDRIDRVYGPDLMLEVCRRSVEKKQTHYFFGGKEGVPEQLRTALCRRFPGLQVVGTYSPPFRAMTADEEAAFAAEIARLKPDYLWVGLSTPKQERWMADHVGSLDTKVMLGVGAAFDFERGSAAPIAPLDAANGPGMVLSTLCRAAQALAPIPEEQPAFHSEHRGSIPGVS